MPFKKKSLSEDKIYCKSIAKSISDIIRFSLDEDFRKKSFELFQVSSTKATEREIKRRLMVLLQNKKTCVQAGKLTAQEETQHSTTRKDEEKENTAAKNDSQNVTEAVSTPSTTTESNSQSSPQNIFKTNWLEISSRQYRETIKRKKLNYHSQPQFGQRLQNDLEFLSCRTYTSSSQPSSSCFSPFSEGRIAPSQTSSEAANYFREKFRDSLRDNAEKYFKENSKSQSLLPKTSQITGKFHF